MNYKNIYYSLMDYCKSTKPFDRIYRRNLNDKRLNDDYIYTEKHHITPRHSGGDDSEGNLVELLPEEHFLAHLLRYKAYGDRNDFLAVRMIINGYTNKPHLTKHLERLPFNKRIGLFKAMIQSFRKKHGWHTPEGVKRISESRKGTLPCVDIETGEKVGMQSVDHPNVINGKWVHHSHGMVTSFDTITNKKVRITTAEKRSNPDRYKHYVTRSGENNTNYREMTEERINRIFKHIPQSIDEGYLRQYVLIDHLKQEFKEWKRLSVNWILNHFGSLQNMLNMYNELNGTSYRYDSHYRSESQKKKIADKNKFAWFTDGHINLQVKLQDIDEFVKKNLSFKRGRAKKC